MELSPMVRIRICAHRVQQGLSIAEAAHRAGVSPVVWEGVESGSEPLTEELLSRIAQLLEVSVEYLLLGFDKIIYARWRDEAKAASRFGGCRHEEAAASPN
ncbi:MAG: helix-turn-helix transcriptional regulator [Firmicutes bacterium]|nr:helix-turn-helix transcriptional regulator [Bacillota bacterium]